MTDLRSPLATIPRVKHGGDANCDTNGLSEGRDLWRSDIHVAFPRHSPLGSPRVNINIMFSQPIYTPEVLPDPVFEELWRKHQISLLKKCCVCALLPLPERAYKCKQPKNDGKRKRQSFSYYSQLGIFALTSRMQDVRRLWCVLHTEHRAKGGARLCPLRGTNLGSYPWRIRDQAFNNATRRVARLQFALPTLCGWKMRLPRLSLRARVAPEELQGREGSHPQP